MIPRLLEALSAAARSLAAAGAGMNVCRVAWPDALPAALAMVPWPAGPLL